MMSGIFAANVANADHTSAIQPIREIMSLVERRPDNTLGRRSVPGRPQARGRNTPETELLLHTISVQFQSLLGESLPSLRTSMIDAGRAFLMESRDDLQRWSGLLASQSISEKEFQWLIRARVHLSEMEPLHSAGMSTVRIDELRLAMVRAITNATNRLIGL
jgi:hypothetical protein